LVTRVMGGVGSHQLKGAGDVTGDVISRDIEGTSGTVNHDLRSADPNYDGLVVPGVDLTVAQGGQGQVIIEESDGFTAVSETASGAIGTSDSYTVHLAQKPTANVYVTVRAATSPQEEADGFPFGASILLAAGVILPGVVDYFRHILLNGVMTAVKQRAIVLVFSPDDNAPNAWNKKQTVDVGAVNDNRPEGDRVVIPTHPLITPQPPGHQRRPGLRRGHCPQRRGHRPRQRPAGHRRDAGR